MNRRKLQIGVYIFMAAVLFCAGKIVFADATEAKNATVTLLQNADTQNGKLVGMKGQGDETAEADEQQDATEDVDADGSQGVTEDSMAEDNVTDAAGTQDEVPDETAGTDEAQNGQTDVAGSTDSSEKKSTSSASGGQTKEMRAVWIYFNELDKQATSYEKWKSYIDKTFDTSKAKKMNTVILQVRPCADAMYPSSYFPWSVYATGKAGKSPGFDPLKYAVSAAHKRGLSIQAWINPYRITLSSTKISSLPSDSIARKWATSKKKSEKRNVLKVNGALYFNPASSQVQSLVANGVREIVKKYDVDGIHMDDYFYPSLGTANYKKFDYSEYKTYVKVCKKNKTTRLSLVGWRRSNVNKMVKKVYAAVKKADKNCVFGISPAGNLDNLYSATNYYSDVKAWMNSTNYIDYICPQIYWSFTQKSAPYKKMVKEWTAIPRKNQVKLYIGLAGYRAGISLKEAKAVTDPGWAKSNTILKRQVEYARSTKQVSGFCIFSYGVFTRKSAAKEVKNLMKVLN